MKDLSKYYRGYVSIDVNAIRDNLVAMIDKVSDGTEILAVLEADGYGHGGVPIAKKIDDLCYGYCLATVDEGAIFRKHNITKPIYILGYVPASEYKELVEYNLIPPIFTYEDAKELSQFAKKEGKVVDVNIALDTGMSRIGFFPTTQAAKEIEKITKLENINVTTIFTHFAKADYKDKEHANNQLKLFDDFVKELDKLGISIPIHTVANSAATMEMRQCDKTLDRIGISLYGLYPSDEMDMDHIKLKPALSWHTHVAYIKEIEPGMGVSYGSTFVADEKMTVATIPVGYADGYPRNLSNKGYVLINGKKAPILGRVCMDQFMVDVTGIDVKRHDLVTLIGKDGDLEIKMDDYAVLAGTFNYEFACNISKRIPRVAYFDNEIYCTKDYFDDEYKFD